MTTLILIDKLTFRLIVPCFCVYCAMYYIHVYMFVYIGIRSSILLTKVDKVDKDVSANVCNMYSSASIERIRHDVSSVCGYQVNQVLPVKL